MRPPPEAIQEARTLREYVDRFGELPDSRRLSPAVFERLPQLARMALDRGSALTDQELNLSADPGEEAAI